jgi:hypothetical protein
VPVHPTCIPPSYGHRRAEAGRGERAVFVWYHIMTFKHHHLQVNQVLQQQQFSFDSDASRLRPPTSPALALAKLRFTHRQPLSKALQPCKISSARAHLIVIFPGTGERAKRPALGYPNVSKQRSTRQNFHASAPLRLGSSAKRIRGWG